MAVNSHLSIMSEQTDWKARAMELEQRLLSVMRSHEDMLQEKRHLEFKLLRMKAESEREISRRVQRLNNQLKTLEAENAALLRVIKLGLPVS